MLILSRRDVHAVLDGHDDDVCRVVRDTYVAHAGHRTSVPHSSFLRFPGRPQDRIIALPAYVGGARPVAGIKWIASFPANVDRGLERASAAILLNSLDDGRPVALLEGAVISARRTAASAAVAAEALTAGAPAEVRTGASLVGCGLINFEVLRMLRSRLPGLSRITVHDLAPQRARAFAARVAQHWPELTVDIADDADGALAAHRIVSLATTAGEPHLGTGACRPGTLLLHLSLRDLTVDAVLAARNVVDDTDHVLRAGTSLELAEQRSGGRAFVTAEIGPVLAGAAECSHDPAAVTVFSPFGLGALDAALAAYVLDRAAELGCGVRITDFADDVDTHAMAS